jgi:hypothetical protein
MKPDPLLEELLEPEPDDPLAPLPEELPDEPEDDEEDEDDTPPPLTVWPTRPERAVIVPSVGAVSTVPASFCWAETKVACADTIAA